MRASAYFFLVGGALIAISAVIGYLADLRTGRPIGFDVVPILQTIMALGIGGVLYVISEGRS